MNVVIVFYHVVGLKLDFTIAVITIASVNTVVHLAIVKVLVHVRAIGWIALVTLVIPVGVVIGGVVVVGAVELIEPVFEVITGVEVEPAIMRPSVVAGRVLSTIIVAVVGGNLVEHPVVVTVVV